MPLSRWPEPVRAALEACVDGLEGPSYAVFDADGTLWNHDLEMALLALLDVRGEVRPETLDPAVLPVPPLPGESLLAYYDRILPLDTGLAYLWIAQVFAGWSLGELDALIGELVRSRGPIGTSRMHPPRVRAGMRELVSWLESRGVAVWIVSAALEELVRLRVGREEDPLPIRPERVLGLNLMLTDGLTLRSSAADRRDGLSGEGFRSAERMRRRLTWFPTSPTTWYHGKVAAIRTWIDAEQGPCLAAGDSGSDLPMLRTVRPGGVALLVGGEEEPTPDAEGRVLHVRGVDIG